MTSVHRQFEPGDTGLAVERGFCRGSVIISLLSWDVVIRCDGLSRLWSAINGGGLFTMNHGYVFRRYSWIFSLLEQWR